MRILLLTRYSRMGSTSRIRAYQYLPYLRAQGIKIIEAPLFGDEYLRRRYAGKPPRYERLFFAYLRRLAFFLRSFRFELLWIEKELLPSLPAWGEALLASGGVPYVVDYDDATFHWYDMHPNRAIRLLLRQKIDAVMRGAALVIVGNDYLAARARRAGAKRIEYLPSVVDLERYKLASGLGKDRQGFSIGWIGSPVTTHCLDLVGSALRQVCKEGNGRLIMVGAAQTRLEGIPVEIRTWSEDTEVADIQSFDVGIMPLADAPWERGKCGYKLIQSMACGKPAVASPVGINRQIIEHGVNGFLAATTREWVCALETLRENYRLRESMGLRARTKVEMAYSLQATAPRLLSLLRSIVVEHH
jgi:glycosyltransferase involved in cell wall biosynthesis